MVDSGSTDGTVAVAEALGARVVQTDWPGFGPQKNRAWDLASQPWVLSLDADEWLDAEGAAAVEACVREDRPGAWALRRRNRYCGRPVRGGAWGPSWKVRLARKADARWTDAAVHEVLEATVPVQRLGGLLEHDPFREPADHHAQIEGYARLFVAESQRIGRRPSALARWTRPFLHIVKSLLLRGGWRDGALGWHLARLGAREVALKWRLLGEQTGKIEAGTGLANRPD